MSTTRSGKKYAANSIVVALKRKTKQAKLPEKALEERDINGEDQQSPFDDQLLTIDQIRQRDKSCEDNNSPAFQFEYDILDINDAIRENDEEYSRQQGNEECIENNWAYKFEIECIENSQPIITSKIEKVIPDTNSEPTIILTAEQVDRIKSNRSHALMKLAQNGNNDSGLKTVTSSSVTSQTISGSKKCGWSYETSNAMCPSKQQRGQQSDLNQITPMATLKNSDYSDSSTTPYSGVIRGREGVPKRGTIDEHYGCRGFTDDSLSSQVILVSSQKAEVPLIERWGDNTVRRVNTSRATNVTGLTPEQIEQFLAL